MRREVEAKKIIERIKGKKGTKLTKDYLIDEREEVDLYKVTKVGIENGQIVGLIEYHQYHKPHEDSGMSYTVDNNEYSFTFLPSKKLLILLGKSTTKKFVAKILLELAHKVKIDFLEEFEFSKDQIWKIFENLRAESLENNIYNPQFHFAKLYDSFYKLFCYAGDDDVCATKSNKFKEAFAKCDYWEPEFRIFNCVGIAEVDLNPKKHLVIKKAGTISFPSGKTYNEWYNFLYKICKEIFA